MDSNQPGTSKNAKRRAAKKAKEGEAADPAPAPAPAKVKEAAPVADSKAKAKAAPNADEKKVVQSEPRPESKPKAEAKSVAKAKAKGAAKSAPKSEPPKEAEPVDPFFRVDDGTGGDWEVSTGASKKQQRRLMKKEEQSMMQASLTGGNANAEVALQNRAVVGNTPAPVESKAKIEVAKAVEIIVSGASAADKDKSEAVVEKTPTSSVTITVPEEKIGIVIGPKGAKIKLIQEKTGVARIDTTGGIFTITGEPSKVSLAEGAIRDLIDKGYTSLAFDDFQENFVQVHPSSIPDIIGKSGVIIRKMKEELGVEVSVPPVPKNSKTSKKYKVMIAGSAEKVERAKTAINNICMYYHDETTHPGEVHEEIAVEDWMYSYIIGRGGSETKHIQANFVVKMYIPREFSPNQNVVIVGEPNNVARAKAYVEKVLWKAEHEPRGRDKVDDGDVWGKDDAMEPWMEQYMYKR